MAGKSVNSLGARNWSPGPSSSRYNVSGKNREFYTFENAPGLGNYATGGVVIDGGDGYVYHVFTGDGVFQVTRPAAVIDSVDYLVVAGGGAGGAPVVAAIGGGGGGGGMRSGSVNVSLAPGTYPITVGAGGAASAPIPAKNGSPSAAFAITATGGGGGGSPPAGSGQQGGSGGGGSTGPAVPTGQAVATVPRQGYPGGVTTPLSGAGGGGAGGIGGSGVSGPPAIGGAGGPGRIEPHFPAGIIKQAIPAPMRADWEAAVGTRGYAGGGPSYLTPTPNNRPAPAFSGGGGSPSNLAGGSGIVIVRYRKSSPYQRATGGIVEPSTHPEHIGVWRHIFTQPGTFEVTDPSLQWIDYLAVGGGGGGGNSPGGFSTTTAPFGTGGASTGGGGGAGGFATSIQASTTVPNGYNDNYPWAPGVFVKARNMYAVSAGSYAVTVGSGGNAATPGESTTFGSPGPDQIVAVGGGAGGSGGSNGSPGGSGGGTGKLWANYTGAWGGTNPSPQVQGNNGGSAPGFPTYFTNGAGGGGAGAAAPTVVSAPSPGGAGWYSVLSPSAYGTPGPITGYRYFAGGGGGGGGTSPSPTGAVPTFTNQPGGDGSVGGGGAGAPMTPRVGSPGAANTGGGGGGAGGKSPTSAGAPGTASGGTGGSGILIIQYPE